MLLSPKFLIDNYLLIEKEDFCILLNKNVDYFWFIVVPETDTEDFLDLDEEKQSKYLRLCTKLNGFLKNCKGFRKTNFGAIGNVVNQMHLHVVGRAENDPVWPKVVWGNTQIINEYSEKEIEFIRKEVVAFLEEDL